VNGPDAVRGVSDGAECVVRADLEQIVGSAHNRRPAEVINGEACSLGPLRRGDQARHDGPASAPVLVERPDLRVRAPGCAGQRLDSPVVGAVRKCGGRRVCERVGVRVNQKFGEPHGGTELHVVSGCGGHGRPFEGRHADGRGAVAGGLSAVCRADELGRVCDRGRLQSRAAGHGRDHDHGGHGQAGDEIDGESDECFHGSPLSGDWPG